MMDAVSERDVLVALFRDYSLFVWATTRLQPDDFQDQVKGDIYFTMRRMWHQYREPLTLVALNAEIEQAIAEERFFQEDFPIILEMMAAFESGVIMQKWSKEQLTSWLKQKAYVQFSSETQEAYATGKIEDIHDAYKVLRTRVAQDVGKPEDFFTRWTEIAEGMADMHGRLIPTGLGEVDTLLAGGLFKGEFGLVFGVEGLGKSFLLNQFGYGGIFDGNRVLHCTNEMPSIDVETRYLTKITDIPKEQFGQKIDKIRQLQELHQSYVGSLDVCYVPPGESTDTVYAMLENARAENRPYDLVLIDYMDRFHVPKEVPQWQGLITICDDFSAMAKPEEDGGFNVCIVAVTHADSKAYGKRRVGAQNMGLSKIGKNKSVDFALAIGQDEKSRERNIVHLHQTKLRNRYSAKKILACEQAFETGSFIPVEFMEKDE